MKARENKINKKRIFITIIAGILAVLAFYLISSAITKYTGYSVGDKETDFKACLKEKTLVLYVNTEDLASSLQKLKLIEYSDYFEIINCAINNKPCLEKDISSFPDPTYIIEGKKVIGDISINKLSEISGCKYAE